MQNVPKLLNQWLLIDVLITIFIGVSLPTQLVAQSENWLIESPPVTDFVGSAAFDSAPDSLISRSTEAALGTGVFVHPVYYGEVFTNARGGISTNDATQYQALLNIPMAFDFEQMFLPVPGRFFLLAQNTHGRGLTDDFVGDTLVLSNIDSFNNIMQVSEYWWEFDLLPDAVTVRLGKQDVNTEFLFVDLAADFIQSTFGLSPSTAFPTYPDPSMGAVVLAKLSESWKLKVGVWDAFASGGTWGFSGNDTVLVIGELEYEYVLFETLPGTLAGGAAYESAGVLLGEPISAVREYFLQIEQQIYREYSCDEEDNQGLAVFAGYYPRFPGWQVAAASFGDSFIAGLVYTGLIPFRDKDVLGAGVAWAELFQGGTNEETVFELFYKAQITPRIGVQPDLQYISTPSGIQRDALALGVRFELSL